MKVMIRNAQESDFPCLAGLVQKELGYADLSTKTFYKQMREIEKRPEHMTFVAVSGETVVGFIGLQRAITYEIEGEFLRILVLAVSEEVQGEGLGTALLNHAEQYAQKQGIAFFTLSSSFRRTAAHAFYEKNGYRKTSYAFKKTLFSEK